MLQNLIFGDNLVGMHHGASAYTSKIKRIHFGCTTVHPYKRGFCNTLIELPAYKSKGGARPFLGSDAHVKDKLGARFDRAKAFLDGIFG